MNFDWNQQDYTVSKIKYVTLSLIPIVFYLNSVLSMTQKSTAQSAVAVEYIDRIYADS